MAAVLQYLPEDDYCHVRPVRAPLHVVPEVREVLRRPSPRVTRSHSAAVYWRRRFVATALGLGVVLAAVHAGAALGGTTTTASERSPHVTTVVAQSGDTLWSIARRVAPNDDPRRVVDSLAASRGGADVRPGDVIKWSD